MSELSLVKEMEGLAQVVSPLPLWDVQGSSSGRLILDPSPVLMEPNEMIQQTIVRIQYVLAACL